jgi:hypothetical protein
LRLLWGELVQGVHGSLAGTLARCLQLAFGAMSERLRAHAGERLERWAQLLPRVDTATLTAQPLPIQKAGPGELESHARTREMRDRLAVQSVEALGGTMKLDSAAGSGTSLVVTLPLEVPA